MTILDADIKELGKHTQHNTDHTRSLIRSLNDVQDIVAHGRSLYSERV